MLGAFDDAEEIDRPDLNKCPDCSCFFTQDNCPLCGKPCPEEMKAGNRKVEKVKKKNRGYYSGRVTFVPWYHSWWFILIMLLIFPVVGIILAAASPHKKAAKIILICLGVLSILVSYVAPAMFWREMDAFMNGENPWGSPVNDKLSREEYMASCEKTDTETFFRSVGEYKDRFVCMELTVVEKIIGEDADRYYAGNEVYYLCQDESGERFQVLLRDCLLDGSKNFAVGDSVTVYGEGAGNITLEYYLGEYTSISAPCLKMAYAQLN